MKNSNQKLFLHGIGKIIFTAFLFISFYGTGELYSQEISAQKLFEQYGNSIVVIKCYDQNGIIKSQGSGVILVDKGILVTNFHVFAGSDKIEISHNDTVISYSDIIGINIEKDILVLKMGETNFPNLSVGNSSGIKIGEKVYAIGSPLGLENTMSEGIVSGFRILGKNKRNFIQITASLSPGSSGGAVFNSSGELIGISTAKMLKGENLNFVIPIKEVLSVADSGLYDNRSIAALKFFYKGLSAYENGDDIDAIHNYSKYLEMFPQDSKAYNYRGLVYLEKKDIPNALKDFQKAIEIDKDNIAALCNRGECYYQKEEYGKALSDFAKVISIDTTYLHAYFARALTYSKLEDY